MERIYRIQIKIKHTDNYRHSFYIAWKLFLFLGLIYVGYNINTAWFMTEILCRWDHCWSNTYVIIMPMPAAFKSGPVPNIVA